MPARSLAVLGTGSDVGKSVVVTALCRIFSNLGVRVAPFKAQNMSNNSFVTSAGGEIGRAQVAQAEAARVSVHVDMNPVLLKPCTDTGAQVVIHGRPAGNRTAAEYFADTSSLFSEALASLDRLRERHELVVMEGAGSCAEMNLQSRDIVNFRMARAADAPVVLVADIDRGGVFAQLIGTVEIISPEDRARIGGFLINRFRGDARLFEDGIRYIERRTGIPVLGLVPYYRHIEIDAEDGMPLEVVVLAKCLANWLVTGLPLLIAAPILAVLLNMDASGFGTLIAAMALGTPVLSLIGAIGAALTVGARRGGVLLSLLVLPIYIPVLIFGVGAVEAAVLDISARPYLLALGGLLLAALPLAPWASAAALHQALE